MFRRADVSDKYLLGCAAAFALFAPLAAAGAEPVHVSRGESHIVAFDYVATRTVEMAQNSSTPTVWQRNANHRRHKRSWRRHHDETGLSPAEEGPVLAEV